MQTPRTWASAAALPSAILASALILAGCELIASVDRSMIPYPSEDASPPMTEDAAAIEPDAGAGVDAAGGAGPDASVVVDSGGAGNSDAALDGAVVADASLAPPDADQMGTPDVAAMPAGKVIYLTSMPKKANFGGITGADALCNANPPVAGTYKALLSDGKVRGVGIDWALAANTTYVRADKTTVIGTTKADATFAFPLNASLDTNPVSYWTGLGANWSNSADDCNDWSGTAGFSATAGLADATDSQAIMGVVDSCATLAGNFFACVQQ